MSDAQPQKQNKGQNQQKGQQHKGGGKADMAMAGGTDPSRLAEALASVPAWVGERA